MNLARTVAVMLNRLCGLALLILGLLIWIAGADSLRGIHILLGLVMVLALWTLAGLGAAAGIPTPMVLVGFLWGLLLPALGLTQEQILTAPNLHWVIQALHLLVGVGAIGLGEALSARIRSKATAP